MRQAPRTEVANNEHTDRRSAGTAFSAPRELYRRHAPAVKRAKGHPGSTTMGFGAPTVSVDAFCLNLILLRAASEEAGFNTVGASGG